MKAAAVTPGYKVMPNGSYKPISKGDEPVKPALIKLNVPKKKPVVLQPAYTKVPSLPFFLFKKSDKKEGIPVF